MKKFISVLSSLCLAASSLVSALPSQLTASAASVKAGNIAYDLIPEGKDYTTSGGYNVVDVEPGETLTIDWIVSNDAAEIGGLEFTFDTSKVTVDTSTVKRGSAYKIAPTINTDNTGEITYVFATDKIFHAEDKAVILSMGVTAPTAKGSYSIGLKSGEHQIAAGHEKGVQYDYTFTGITLNVGGETTPGSSSSSASSTSTTKADPNAIVYDLVPAGLTYTFDGTNNVVNVAAGDVVAVNWTVKNDAAEVGGLEFTFDTSKVAAVTDVKRGAAYKIAPNINPDIDGQVTYVFATDKIFHAEDGAVIMSMNVTAPSGNGDYTIGLKAGENQISAGHEKGSKNDYVFHGLTLHVSETEETESSEVTPAGKANWTIDTKVVAGGSDVALPVMVTGDAGTAGFVVKFKYDADLTFNGFTWGDQYTAADDTMFNKDDVVVVWANAKGVDEKADGDILYLNFTAPDAAGEYPVEFVSIEAVNFDQQALTITQKNGAVIVEETTTTSSEQTTTEQTTTEKTTTEETTSSEQTTSTTDSDVTPAGKANWTIDTKVVAAGAEVALPVIVDGDEGTAGFVVQFKYDGSLTFNGFTWGDQYTAADDTMFNKNDVVVVWANAKGIDEKADGNILYLNFTAPSAAGEYPVEFVSIEAVNFDQQALTITQKNGAVIVEETTATTTEETTTETSATESATTESETESTTEEITTTQSATESTTTVSSTTESTTSSESAETTTNTTSTSQIIPQGVCVWDIDDVVGRADTTVKVPVYVLSDQGVAGFAAQFSVPEGFEITGMTWGDAYGNADEVMWNPVDKVLVWADPEGKTQVAEKGSVLAVLEVKIPADAVVGTKYPINFVGEIDAHDGNDQPVDVTGIGGSITIIPNDTVVLGVQDTEGTPGSKVDIPLDMILDPGTGSFTVKLDIPDGLTIDSITFDPEYEANGTFTWDPDTKTLTWTKNEGSDFTPDDRHTIATITVVVPEDAEPGTKYPIGAESVTATDKDGNPLDYIFEGGTLTVIPKDETETTESGTTTTEETTTQSVATETTTTQSVTTETSTTESATSDTTASESETTETTTTVSIVTETSTTESTKTETSTTESVPSDTTTEQTTTTQSETTTSATETTVTTEESKADETSVVTSYTITFDPPTRVNYWSHDDRTFKESGGLNGMNATLTVYKYYVDADGVQQATPFETKELNITAFTNPEENENSPLKIWNNETTASLGKDDWTFEESLDAEHSNKYNLKAYYTYSDDINDPDFDVNGGLPLELGQFNIYIGVKGDYNLDNHVDASDAQSTLQYYVNNLAQIPTSLNEDPELDGEDGLVFFLINVHYRQGRTSADALEDPRTVQADDAQMILQYYVDNLAELGHTWTDIVGYDYLDYFYGDVIE